MKIIILSPIADAIFDSNDLQQLQSQWDIVILKDIVPLSDIKELYDEDPKIVAIDPDFCWRNVPKEIISAMKNVQAICLQTTSFSWIDIDAAKQSNIPVVNLRWFSTQSVAERAIMMTLNVARKVPMIIKDSWKADFVLHQWIELRWKTAGIIGLGAIGKSIAQLCTWLGMNIVYWSKSSRDDRFSHVSLDELMSQSDIIFPTVAQNEETTWLITDDMLLSMKKSAIFASIIHVDKIYNHNLVIKLVESWAIYGYAYESENEKINDFTGNIRVWPALARCTSESFEKNAKMRMEAITCAALGKYDNQVNTV